LTSFIFFSLIVSANLVKHLLKIVKSMQLLFQKLNLDAILPVLFPGRELKLKIAEYSIPVHLNH